MAEIVAIVSIFVVLPAIIVQAGTTVKKAKYAAMDAKGGDGLRASDLQRLIQDAVEDAVAPLHDRLDELTEARAEPRLDPGVLADALEDPEDEDDVAAVRRRTRS